MARLLPLVLLLAALAVASATASGPRVGLRGRAALRSLQQAGAAAAPAPARGPTAAPGAAALPKTPVTNPPILPGATFVPAGGKGSWESAGNTGVVFIYGTVMQDGEVIGWANMNTRLGDYGTAIYYPGKKSSMELLDGCGISDCKNAFCAGQVLTPDNELLVFGGHGEKKDLEGFRSFDGSSGTLRGGGMPSGRWYPTPTTLPDGKVLVVGGVKKNGQTGYFAYVKPDRRDEYDNPTYVVYDPAARAFSEDKQEMRAQLEKAWPVHTYPWVILTPDGGVVMSAGSTLVKYDRSDDTTFARAYEMAPRPHAPWSYPQTGQGVLLPLSPPYTQFHFIAAGGSVKDKATNFTAASDAAHIIDLNAGEGAEWRDIGPMPYPRVLGDATMLCDGTIVFMGGGEKGIAGWGEHPHFYEFKDGTTWDCPWNCTDVYDFLYEPIIYDPATGKWSQKGSLAEASRPRLYHSIHVLLPDCRVMAAGGDVSDDHTAEFWSPPYLSKGPRPVITAAPASMKPGDTLKLGYTSADPVTKALLLRTGAVTHSMSFDQRALWLDIASNAGGQIELKTPASPALLPPGMYMVTLITDKGVPSEAKILPNRAPGASGSSGSDSGDGGKSGSAGGADGGADSGDGGADSGADEGGSSSAY